MKALGLISSPFDPASRVRILQYEKHLAQFDILLRTRYYRPLRETDPPAWARKAGKVSNTNPWRWSNVVKTISRSALLVSQLNYDVIWQNRLVLPHHHFFEKKFSRPLVFDMDDAIWLNEGEKHVQFALQKATMVFAGNEYLFDYASGFAKKVIYIPSVVDTEVFTPSSHLHGPFTIGWIGSRSNFPYLDIIHDVILEFLSVHKDSRFIIVSSEMPRQFQFDQERIVFNKWNASTENELINQFSVGLMPLVNDEWTKGKCGYKMLQYMACGKPVIISNAGVGPEILSKKTSGLVADSKTGWINALDTFYNDQELLQEYGRNARSIVEDHFSIRRYAPVVAAHLKEIIP